MTENIPIMGNNEGQIENVVASPEAVKELASTSSSGLSDEPVSLVQIVHLVLATLVTLGWLKIDNSTIDVLGTIVAALISTGAQLWARSRVTPIKK